MSLSHHGVNHSRPLTLFLFLSRTYTRNIRLLEIKEFIFLETGILQYIYVV